MGETVDGSRTELSQAIEAVRAGLADAQRAGNAAGGLRFTVEQVELEFSVELRRSTRGDGGVKAMVVSANAAHDRAHTESNRVKVVLNVANGELISDDGGAVLPPRPSPGSPGRDG
ncbi:trypco2 family protein [Streptomyces sp. NPDC048428]|uniref:trypco2 family protein n=1 Tax=Streptomyces sp. NPDC048428 TaxID=3154503 RepID=UPI0034359686